MSTFPVVSCARVKKPALIAAVAGLALCALGFVVDRAQFAESWLMGWNYWFFIASGSLGWLMIYHLVSGRWGYVIQRPLEAAARTIPVLLLLFLPVFLCMHELYEWTHEEVIANDHIVQKKLAYLNVPGFALRFVIYAVIWTGLALILTGLSRKLDDHPDAAVVKKLRAWSAPGLVLFGIATSFASFDWLMSLEPHWFSSIYGAQYMVWQGLTTLLFMVIVLRFLVQQDPLNRVVTPRQIHDLGNLTFAFTILWAYMAFGQFLIIWSGNLYEGTFWYMYRTEGGWQIVSWILFIGHFALPFLALLIRANKVRIGVLAGICLFLLVVRNADLYWQVAPTFRKTPFAVSWLDPAAWVGIGGLFVYLFASQLEKRPVLNRDPRFTEFAEGGKDGH